MKAFYHETRGHWFTSTDDVPDDVLSSYPRGTIETPLPPAPNYDWNGAEWVQRPPAPVGPADLSPAQFEWLLAFTGLGDVWDGIEAALKDTDRATYAAIRMQRKRSVYQLDVTLQEVAKMRPVAAKIAPDVDLSDAAIKAAWDLAEAV
jgi:hypothetical protein